MEYPIGISVRTQRGSVVWRQKVQPNEVQLAYLEAPPVYSHEAISASDYLSEILDVSESTVYTSPTSVVLSDRDNLIFTTVTAMTEDGLQPMFFGHRISAALKEGNVPSLKLWNKSTTGEGYTYNSNYKAIFSNINNQVDIKNNSYKASYVNYETADKTISEVYKNELVFREKNIYDASFAPGEYHPVYVKERVAGGWRYTFPYINGETVYYKEYTPNSEIIKISENSSIKYQWPIELNRSSVSVNVPNFLGTEYQKVSYSWNNPTDIFYFPYYPYISQKKECSYINDQAFFAPSKNITLDTEKNLHLTFKVIRDGKVIIGQSTKESLIGKRLSGSFRDRDLVNWELFDGGVDYSLGVITFNGKPLRPDDFIVAEYVVKDEYLEKEIYNANPTQNPWLLKGSILIYSSANSPATGYAKIYYIKVRTIWDSSRKKLLIIDSGNDPSINAYVGGPVSTFISDTFIYDPFTQNFAETTSGKNLLITSVGFNKEIYTNNVKYKDVRVFAGVKDDLAIENKGRDFLFSQILNPTDQYNLQLENQIMVLVDRSEIPDYAPKDIPGEVRKTVNKGFITHLKYKDYPVVKKAFLVNGDLTLVVDYPSTMFTDLYVYWNSNRIIYDASPVLLTGHGLEGNPIGELTLTKSIAGTLPEGTILNLPQHMFVRWEGTNIPTSNSPIFSVISVTEE